MHPSLPVKTTRELIAFVKARPSEINFASAGTGSEVHLATELFLYMTNIKMNHIPYKGTWPALTDTIAGQTEPDIRHHLDDVADRLRAIAVTTAQRVATEPNIPTVAESGVPGYESSGWYGMLVTGGTPKPRLAKLH